MAGTRDAPSKPQPTYGWALIPILAFVAIAGVFAYALRSGDPSILPSALIGEHIPNTSFEPLKNLVRDNSPVPGFNARDIVQENSENPVVINFWASWCGPCKLEHPQIETLAKRYGIDVYGVNYKDEKVAARSYLVKLGNPYKAVGTDTKGRGAIEWGVTKMPETFVVSPTGIITYKFSGPITKDVLDQKILPAIERAKRSD